MNRNSGMQHDLVQIIFSGYDEDGIPIVSYDAYGGKNASVAPSEIHWPAGLFGRARDPDLDRDGNPKKGAYVWHVTEGDISHYVPASDPRAVVKLPRQKKGGHGLYGDTGHGQLPYAVFDGEDGSFTLYVPYEFTGEFGKDTPSKAMAISVDVSNPGSENIQIVHGAGSAISMLQDGSVHIVASDKGSSVSVSPGGQIVINGNAVINGGATIGSPTGALPATIAPKLIAYLEALELDIAASMTAIGAGAAAAGALGTTKFAATAAARATLMASIAALNTSVF